MGASPRIRSAFVALLVAFAPFLIGTTASGRVLDDKMHHLRSGAEREWSDFPERAEGREWVLAFDAKTNDAEQTLRLRHRDLKQVWTVALNGKELGKLPLDENEMVTFWAVPPGTLREGPNELRVSCSAGAADASDDVLVGMAELLDAPRAKVLSAATLAVSVVDGDGGAPVPCRITLADERGGLVSLGTTSDAHLAIRPGVVYTSDGRARLALPAGQYTVYAGRGFEYSLATAKIELREGDAKEQKLSIRRVVPTPGYVACDTHVHTFTYSRHGDATIEERMVTLAGEGIELPIATDHNLQIDYEKPAQDAGVRKYFTPVIGNEVTTAALGHFNVFPIAKSAKLINWRGRDWAAIARDIAEVAGEDGKKQPVVVLNHARDIHGGFRPFDPSRHISLTGEDLDGKPPPANAMEVINSGATMNDPMQLYRDWFGMLNRGWQLTPVGASDSHDVSRFIVGQGRTYVRCDDKVAGQIDVEQAVKSFREGRVLVSYGLLVEITVAGRFGPGDLVAAKDVEEGIDVDIRVLGPGWTRATQVILYANGLKVREEEIKPPADNPQPAGEKWRGRWTLPRPRHDVHLVAIALGDGISAPYWPTARPYQPTSPAWTPYFIGSTGAVWIDADGSGRFDCAYDIARGICDDAKNDMRTVLTALPGFDQAIAAQAASILRERFPDGFADKARAAIATDTSPGARRGFEAYLAAWEESQAAKAASTTRPTGK